MSRREFRRLAADRRGGALVHRRLRLTMECQATGFPMGRRSGRSRLQREETIVIGMRACDRRGGFGAILILAVGAGVALAQNDAGSPGKSANPARRASIYDKTADAKVQVERATARAEREGQRVLLM